MIKLQTTQTSLATAKKKILINDDAMLLKVWFSCLQRAPWIAAGQRWT
jgi:hypothetical protein